MIWTGTPIPVGVSFAFYVANGGSLSEGRFLAALPQALAAVDEAIWPNAIDGAARPAYQRTVCAVVDLIDSPALAAERVGNVAVTYSDVPTVARAIKHGLSGTGLLYRGL